MLHFTITGKPITKKNSQRIVINKRTGSPFPLPSKQFESYKKEFLQQAKKFQPSSPLDVPISVATVYYMPTRHRVDITNLMNATHDLLQDAGIIADDSSKIVKSVDGSRVFYDKGNPRVEITIMAYE